MNNFKITPVEVERKCFIYDYTNSISFSEIEQEIKKRTKHLFIKVYGIYDPKYLIEPTVYLQVDFEGYHYRQILEKKIFNEKDVDNYYDYLADNIAHQFAYKFFRKIDNKGE